MLRNTPEKPSFEQALAILSAVVKRKARSAEKLIELGFARPHIAYMEKSYVLPSCGGIITGFSYLEDHAKAQYDYFVEVDTAKEEWDSVD